MCNRSWAISFFFLQLQKGLAEILYMTPWKHTHWPKLTVYFRVIGEITGNCNMSNSIGLDQWLPTFSRPWLTEPNIGVTVVKRSMWRHSCFGAACPQRLARSLAVLSEDGVYSVSLHASVVAIMDTLYPISRIRCPILRGLFPLPFPL